MQAFYIALCLCVLGTSAKSCHDTFKARKLTCAVGEVAGTLEMYHVKCIYGQVCGKVVRGGLRTPSRRKILP